MSFGYLIITPRPCPILTKKRYETFFPLNYKDHNAYFLFSEGVLYTKRLSENESLITDKGIIFFKNVHDYIGSKFLFADTLLGKREGAEDFADEVLKKLRKNIVVPTIQVEQGLKINLRQPYFITVK